MTEAPRKGSGHTSSRLSIDIAGSDHDMQSTRNSSVASLVPPRLKKVSKKSLIRWGRLRELVDDPINNILTVLTEIRDNFLEYITEQKKGVQLNQTHSAPERLSNIHPPTISEDDGSNLTKPQTSRQISAKSSKTTKRTPDQLGEYIFGRLEWCLEQLNNVHGTQDTSNMIKSELKRKLTHDMSLIKEHSALIDYIRNQYLETNDTYFEEEDARDNTLDDRTESMFSQSIPSQFKLINVMRERGHIFINAPDLKKILKKIDSWDVNIFEIDALSQSWPLTCVVFTVFTKWDLFAKFDIDPNTLTNYLLQVEENYRDVNTYHNSIHAADVVQSAYVLLSSEAVSSITTDLDRLAIIIACAIHDVDHPGFSNNYLINTQSDLAFLYNNESVLENHHISVGLRLLQGDNCNILRNLSKKQVYSFRKIVKDIVLATDMAKHVTVIADFRAVAECKGKENNPLKQPHNNPDAKMAVFKAMVHCCDLANPTKPFKIYVNWVNRIKEEFFRQGDLELSQGLDFSPMCDREKTDMDKCQVGFIKLIVSPIWEDWGQFVESEADHMLHQLDDNKECYIAIGGVHKFSALESTIVTMRRTTLSNSIQFK